MAGKKRIVEVTVEDVLTPVDVVEKISEPGAKGMDKIRKNLLKINGDMQIELIKDYEDLNGIKSFSSGCFALDTIMGFRGYPYGKIIEILGKESSGKSTLAMHAVNSAVNDFGGHALIMDVENGSWEWPKRNLALGLKKENLARVLCIYPATTEDAMNSVVSYIKDLVVDQKVRDAPVVIVWDSIAANTSQDEQGKEIGEIGYLTQCRIISQGHRVLNSLLMENNIKNVTFIWLNQAREAQNKGGPFLPPTIVTFGGKAPAFFSAIRIEVRHKKYIAVTRAGKKIQVGQIVMAKTFKNKLAFARQETDIYLMFASGIDNAYTAYEWLKTQGLIKVQVVDEQGNNECLILLNQNSTVNEPVPLDDKVQAKEAGLLSKKLSFSKLSGFRRCFAEHKDEIQNLMKTHFDDLLASCSQDLMQSDSNDQPSDE